MVVTFETNSVPFQTFHRLFEKSLASRRHAGYIILFPFNWSVYMVEDLFHGIRDFSSDAVPGNECHLLG